MVCSTLPFPELRDEALLPTENLRHFCNVVRKEVLNTKKVNLNIMSMELDYEESSNSYSDNMENFNNVVE
ncbi:hypothetical protein M0802_004319 [Mischocyttarus mexicanus]|nr:hypothetical protein M0802_004319 [Mischocyttarus mexicanus]